MRLSRSPRLNADDLLVLVSLLKNSVVDQYEHSRGTKGTDVSE